MSVITTKELRDARSFFVGGATPGRMRQRSPHISCYPSHFSHTQAHHPARGFCHNREGVGQCRLLAVDPYVAYVAQGYTARWHYCHSLSSKRSNCNCAIQSHRRQCALQNEWARTTARTSDSKAGSHPHGCAAHCRARLYTSIGTCKYGLRQLS